jgi:hypothetical protein
MDGDGGLFKSPARLRRVFSDDWPHRQGVSHAPRKLATSWHDIIRNLPVAVLRHFHLYQRRHRTSYFVVFYYEAWSLSRMRHS